MKRTLHVELLAIDLCSCKRCVPTGEQLKKALEILAPAAEVLEIDLDYREIVVGNPEEAKAHGLVTSPTIRLDGRDIAQDIRESECESCATSRKTTPVWTAGNGSTGDGPTRPPRCRFWWKPSWGRCLTGMSLPSRPTRSIN